MSLARAQEYVEAAARHRAQAAKWAGGPVRAYLLARARIAEENASRETAYAYGRRRPGGFGVSIPVHETRRPAEVRDVDR